MYQTSYANSFSKGVTVKSPLKPTNKTLVINRPTGYNANFRPCIYYTPSLDDLDNPAMKMDVHDHYKRNHDIDFKPYNVGPTGQEMNLKQNDIIPCKSGFTTMWGKTYLAEANAASDSAHSSVNRKLTPKQLRNPILVENQTNSKYLTENNARYHGEQGRWPSQAWRFTKSIGRKEPTATTRVEPFDPIEGNVANPYRHDQPYSSYYHTKRATGRSEQELNFVSHKFHSKLPRENADGIPEPVARSTRLTGYSHECVKPKFTETFSVSKPIGKKSYLDPNRSDAYKCTLARYSFNAPDSNSRRFAEDIKGIKVGRKEATGYVWNHPAYNKTKDTRDRFSTHYNDLFDKTICTPQETCNKATLSLSSGGWPVVKASNGFTKSTRVHAH